VSALAKYRLMRGSVIAAQAAALILFFVFWQLGADHGWIDTFFFSSPKAIWDQITTWYNAGTLGSDVGATMIVLWVGYAVGLGGGILLGIATGAFKWIGELIDPFLVFLNAIPRLILLPIFVIWFGFGYFTQIWLVMTVIIIVVAVNVQAGLREVRFELLQNSRVLGANRLDLIRHVYIPSVAIWITATARVTVGLAFQAAIASEFIGAAKGLGYLVVLGESTQRPQEIFGAIAIMLAIAVVVDTLLGVLERRATRWMPQSAGG
jgi:NitT/TauT family transport system permease protein